MVADLEHVNSGQLAALVDGLQNARLRISSQKYRLGRVAGYHHDARLIGSCVLHRAGWRHHIEFDGAHPQSIAVDQLLHVPRCVALGVADHSEIGLQRARWEQDDRDVND